MTTMAPEGFKGTFSIEQTQQLLAPINPRRVLADPRGNSHVSQRDVTAHLIRVFGFGNFMTELIGLDLVFETCREAKPTEPHREKWDACYRAVMRLTIFDKFHNMVTSYEDASCGDAQNQNRQDAHDLAMKSAISTAKKRCTINLGDQFGLSLYNKGQLGALVMGTKVLPKDYPTEGKGEDVAKDVAQQVSLGIDETEKPDAEATTEQEKLLADSLGATKIEDKA